MTDEEIELLRDQLEAANEYELLRYSIPYLHSLVGALPVALDEIVQLKKRIAELEEDND